MNTYKKAVPCYAVNKSRHILSLSLIALLGAGALGTGPAFAADGIHCLHTIDYNKLSASELEMLTRDIDVTQFANAGATGGKCVAAIDYNKLSAEELEMIDRDINVHHYTKDGMTEGKYVATIDYNKLSAAELDNLYRDIHVTAITGATGNGGSVPALAGKEEPAKGM